MHAAVQRTNSVRCCRWCRECELLLHDVVLAKRNDEEDAEECSGHGERDEFPDIFFGPHRQQMESIKCGHGADEDDADTSGGGSSALDGTILLRSEWST